MALITKVAQVKEKIEAQEKHAAAWQKLIHAGKILDDSATIGSYNLSDTDFLVLMVRKVFGIVVRSLMQKCCSQEKVLHLLHRPLHNL